jgi:hypothetical protein
MKRRLMMKCSGGCIEHHHQVEEALQPGRTYQLGHPLTVDADAVEFA